MYENSKNDESHKVRELGVPHLCNFRTCLWITRTVVIINSTRHSLGADSISENNQFNPHSRGSCPQVIHRFIHNGG